MKAALKSSIFLFFLEQLCYFNLSPQGDGNLDSLDAGNTVDRFQLIPARGRKPEHHWCFKVFIPISTYPRKGTETRSAAVFFSVYQNFNLSPQGDGNFSKAHLEKRAIDFNLSPQGDGNRSTNSKESCRKTFQLIPARGRKPINEPVFASQAVISTYPRKGTETVCFYYSRLNLTYFNLSPQGDGNAS